MRRTRITYIMVFVFFIAFFLLISDEEINGATISFAPRIDSGHLSESFLITNERRIATLPKGITIVEEEAFERTALSQVILPETIVFIGDRAFAGNLKLRNVQFLAEEMQHIGKAAFDEDEKLRISGFYGSYIQEWAKGKRIRFILLEGIKRKKEEKNIFLLPPTRSVSAYVSPKCKTEILWRGKIKATGRSLKELKASLYMGKKSIYVRSRWFP